MVKVTANGKQRITKITIDKELFNPQEVEMLEDLVVAAVNKVLDESSKKAQTELGKVTGGLLSGIPGLGSLGL
jgi:DNA-binding protein YbaB